MAELPRQHAFACVCMRVLLCGVQGDAAFDPVGAAGQTLLYFRSQFTTSDDGLATREALNMNTPFLDGSMVRSAVQCSAGDCALKSCLSIMHAPTRGVFRVPVANPCVYRIRPTRWTCR
jgi:hypothetical protein